eukprot:10282414-Prorocentrum_lima.AAC.1
MQEHDGVGHTEHVGAAGRGWSGRSAVNCCVQPHTMRGASSAAASAAVSPLEPARSLAYGLRNAFTLLGDAVPPDMRTFGAFTYCSN